ncbi:Uu.00g137380.m01.CDS01 [Anthostomella pinea]|uniref:Uu.00g137380.m01.CDS01 n=1 Tax=Anthostomella pinea TaxID=933095 RepID=A0AAI8VQQ0_9PEZI|nr:Uu.00g137380.m01.CDS01 [Anthostomella pinea]
MSLHEVPTPVTLSAQELLAFDEDQLVQFLNDNRNPSGGFDISRVAGVDGFSVGEREQFSEKLSAAATKAGPLNANELTRLLGLFTDPDSSADTPSEARNREIRSPTSSPPPEGNNHRLEAFCHDELVKAGGRPVVPLEFLLHAAKDAGADTEQFEPWLGDTNSGHRDGDVAPVFSAQLEDWLSFQHKWQWDNRDQTIRGEGEGFAAHFESRKRRYLHQGEVDVISDPLLEDTVRHAWEYEDMFLEASGKEGFTAYTQAVRQRLASHSFTKPVQLAKDPRQQDVWTTWVEYLNYIYWWQDHYTAAMKRSRPQYHKVWDELRRFNASPSSTVSTTTRTLKELDATRAELQATRQQIRNFIGGTKAFQRQEIAVRRQEQRAKWVLEQLALVETTAALEIEAAKNDPAASGPKKRKLSSDCDSIPPQPAKRRRENADQCGWDQDLEQEVGNGPDMKRLN